MSSISRLLTRSKEKISFDELNSLAFLSSPIATLLVDEKGMILMVNHVFSQLTGYAKREVVGKNMSLLKSGTYNNAFYQAFWTRMSQTMQHDYEILNRCKDNTVILMRERIMRIDKGTKKYFVVTIEDITEDKKQVEKQHYLAMHDALTGLANRTLLNDRFTHTRLNTVSKGNKMGVLVCDINEFKQINDTFGHSIGDIVLKKVADKLMQLVRSGDTVARYGGDEFVIILDQIEEESELESRMQEIKSSFPVALINEKECFVNLCIGSASFPFEGTTLDQLVGLADVRLYEDKKRYYEL